MKIQSSALLFAVFVSFAAALSGCVSDNAGKGGSVGGVSGEAPGNPLRDGYRRIKPSEPGTGIERIALPFLFERAPKNAGGDAAFVLHRPGYALSVNRTGFEAFLAPLVTGTGERMRGSEADRLAVRFAGAQRTVRLRPVGEPRLYVNRLLGGSPSDWERNVPAYEAVRYEGLYSDIDLILRTDHGQIEYAFDVGPGGTVDQIRLRITGAKRLSLEEGGYLLIEASNGRRIRHRAPLAIEHAVKGPRQLPAAFRLIGHDTVAFQVNGRRKGSRMTIDPVINFGSYFGGTSWDAANMGSGNLPVSALPAGPYSSI